MSCLMLYLLLYAITYQITNYCSFDSYWGDNLNDYSLLKYYCYKDCPLKQTITPNLLLIQSILLQ